MLCSANIFTYNEAFKKDVDSTYELLDKEQSVFQYRHSIYRISELVIDRAKLSEIPLGKRLCMRLKEAPGPTLYHQSAADAVMALEPRGMYFTSIEDFEVL